MHKRSCLLVGTDAPLAGPEFHPKSKDSRVTGANEGNSAALDISKALGVEAVFSLSAWLPARASQFLPVRNYVKQN